MHTNFYNDPFKFLSWNTNNFPMMKLNHYTDVIMTIMASQITSLTVVYSTVYSDADQRKHQSSASLAFMWGIHQDRWILRTKASYAENVSIWWRHHVVCQHKFQNKLQKYKYAYTESIIHLPRYRVCFAHLSHVKCDKHCHYLQKLIQKYDHLRRKWAAKAWFALTCDFL